MLKVGELEWGWTEYGDLARMPKDKAVLELGSIQFRVKLLTVNGVPLADVLRYSAEASDLAAEQKYEDWGTHEMCAAALRALAGRQDNG
jgi:hypothetical protein